MGYILEHTVLGFCWWDLPALLILIGVCVYAFIKLRKMKRQEKALNERLVSTAANKAVQSEFET